MKYLLLFILIALNCSCSDKPAAPVVSFQPAPSIWNEIITDKTIVIDGKIDDYHVFIYDIEKETIHLNKQFRTAIVWKDGDYRNIVCYCPISTGGILTRVNAITKNVIYSIPILGLGPIDHSQYGNDIHLYMNGRVLQIHGDESAGKYDEIRSIDDGKIINISQQYNDAWKPQLGSQIIVH